MNLKRLFQPKNVAVYGGIWSDYVVEQCKKLGFPGKIWRIHPNRKGCFRSAKELPDIPDSVFLGINRNLTIEIFSELKELGIGGAVVFASGFGEENDGEDFARKLEKVAGGVPFIGPNCYGFVNFFDRVALWPDQVTGKYLDRGVAFIAQSGTISITMMGQRRSLPLGYVITLGNQQRLAAEDLIKYTAEDERVSAIGLYLEQINNLSKFVDAVDFARSLGKPIVLIKAGRSEKGRLAAQTHTGSMTGADLLYDSLFERLGIARCENLSSMVETLKILHFFGPLPSKKVLVLGASGGDMAMVSDISKDFDLDFSPIPSKEQEALTNSVGERVKINNPLDIQTATWFDYKKLRQMFDILLRCDYALIAFMVDPQDEIEANTESFDRAIEILLEAVGEKTVSGRAALLSSLPESLSKLTREKCFKNGIVPLQGLVESLEAIHHSFRIRNVWNEWSLPKIVSSQKKELSNKKLNEYESKKVLAKHGFNIPKSLLVTAEKVLNAANEIGYPVVVKVMTEDLLHKTEVGGVELNLRNESEVELALSRMKGIGKFFLVEEMITDSVAEIILGVSVDAQFGLTMTIGAGGIFAELIDDKITFMLPISRLHVSRAISKLRINTLLKGWRGRSLGDTESLIDSVLNLANFVESHIDSLVECEINPLIVRNLGEKAIVVDALIILKEN